MFRPAGRFHFLLDQKYPGAEFLFQSKAQKLIQRAAYISMWALEVIYSNAAMEQKGKPETKKVNPFSARPSGSHKWNYRLTGRPRMTSCHVAPQVAVLATCPDDSWIYGAFRGRLAHCSTNVVFTTVMVYEIGGTVILQLMQHHLIGTTHHEQHSNDKLSLVC